MMDRFEMSMEERLKALFPSADNIPRESMRFFEKEVLPRYSLWYFQPVMEPFGIDGATKIVKMVIKELGDRRMIGWMSLKNTFCLWMACF